GNSLPFLLLLGLAVIACRGPVPEQAVSPRPAPAVVPPTVVPQRTWVFRPGLVGREYRVEQRAQIVSTADTGRQTTDSTSIVLDASVRNVSPASVAGLIRA